MQALGRPVPALENRPEVKPFSRDAFLCYNDLASSDGINWVDFEAWCARYGVDLDDREYLWYVVNEAIRGVEKWRSTKLKSPSGGPPATNPGGPSRTQSR